MWPYAIVLLLSLLSYYLHKRARWVPAFLTVVILAFFVGMRDVTVGTDTAGYARVFLMMGEFPTWISAATGISTEDGWNILNWFIYRITPHYWFLFTFVGVLTSLCAISTIERLSSTPVLSLFLYITLGFYLSGFAGMRQAVALAIYMLAIPQLVNKKIIQYIIIVIIASFFHKTVLVALPLYFVFNLKYSNLTLFIIALGSIIVGFFLPTILSYSASMESRYSVYTEVEGGGTLFAVFYTLMAVFFVFQRSKIIEERRETYDKLLLMLVCGSMIYLIVTFSGVYGEVTRLALYFQVAIVFLWAELYENRVNKLGSSFWAGCILAHLVYFFLYLSRIGDIVPYVMNVSFK